MLRWNYWRTTLFAWMLLLPSLVILMLFTFYPIYKTLILSFHHSDLAVRKPIFIGLDNYKALASDSIFWKVMSNNIWFAIGTVPTSIALALFMAVMANKAIRGKGFLRTAFFYPNVIPMIAIANVWLFIYTPQYGLLSRLLNYVEQGGLNWLGSQQLVMWALIIMIVWREAGYFMIFYLAGLQNVSRDLYEAADVDGAKPWLVFRKITMPLLMPTTLFVMIIAMTNSFKLVDHLFIMTKGGPDNASSLLLYYIYEQAFAFWDLGKASTLTIVMIAVLLLISAVQFFGLDKKIHYE